MSKRIPDSLPADLHYEMIPNLVPRPIAKLNDKKKVKNHIQLPSNETARLLILKQTKIIHSKLKELEYDRFAALAKRILQTEYATISFIDVEAQWTKSAVGGLVTTTVPRAHSLDAMLMFPESPEILVIMDLEDTIHEGKYSSYQDIYSLPNQAAIRFYTAATIVVDGFRVGALSVFDTKPRKHLPIEDRQNLLDLAAAVSNIVKERRQQYLRFKKERANLMLGLNHNLRTPLMSLTLVTEMLRSEVKSLAMSKDHLSQKAHVLSRSEQKIVSAETLLDALCNNTSPRSRAGSIGSRGSSKGASRQQTPDTPCMNLFGDLYGSLQQLGLLVEMGLILGKITSGLAILSDGTYESILCNVTKTYEKVQSLTQRLGRIQNVTWSIDRSKLLHGKHYTHPDVLMFVLISCLTQLLPHCDHIKVKGSFITIEEVHRIVEDENILAALSTTVEVGSPAVIFGNVGILLTEIEAVGDPANLQEIVSKLHLSNNGNLTSGTSSENSDLSVIGPEEAEDYINADVEEFGGSIFALGSLLENVMGGSSFLMKDNGCVFSFSIPCRIEVDPNELLLMEDMNETSSPGKGIPHTLLERVEEEAEADEEEGRNGFNEELAKITEVLEQLDAEAAKNQPQQRQQSSLSAEKKNGDGKFPALPVAIFTKEMIIKPTYLDDSSNIAIIPTNVLPTASFEEFMDKKLEKHPSFTLDPLKETTDEDGHGLLRRRVSRELRVLVVDDSITVQKTLGFWFKKRRCEVTQALNGAIAVDLLKKQVFDLVFMDFLMPVMDGLSCMRAFKAHCMSRSGDEVDGGAIKEPSQSPSQWIVGMSATALAEDQEAAFDTGMHMFCSKPMDMNSLNMILEAKRLGLHYDELASLAANNRDSSMNDEQRDFAVKMMLPIVTNKVISETTTLSLPFSSASSSSLPMLSSSPSSPPTSAEKKLKKDRVELKESFNKEFGGRLNIFGGFRFNPTNK